MSLISEDQDTPVVELIEAHCRRLMAERASLVVTWQHRGERRDLATEIDACLERWNWLTLGR